MYWGELVCEDGWEGTLSDRGRSVVGGVVLLQASITVKMAAGIRDRKNRLLLSLLSSVETLREASLCASLNSNPRRLLTIPDPGRPDGNPSISSPGHGRKRPTFLPRRMCRAPVSVIKLTTLGLEARAATSAT